MHGTLRYRRAFCRLGKVRQRRNIWQVEFDFVEFFANGLEGQKDSGNCGTGHGNASSEPRKCCPRFARNRNFNRNRNRQGTFREHDRPHRGFICND